MSETFNEIQALQDMEDARIGRSRALQAKAALSALNEPFCNKPEHAALEKALSEANARETNLNTHILTLHVQLAAAIRDRDAYKAALQDLCDWQNGPPLASYEKNWTAAFTKALDLLNPTEVQA